MESIAHYGAAMAFCAGHACAGHERNYDRATSQPDETFRMCGLTNACPASLPARGPAHRRSTAFLCRSSQGSHLILVTPGQDQSWNLFNNPGAINSLLCICLKSGKYLKYGRGKGGV